MTRSEFEKKYNYILELYPDLINIYNIYEVEDVGDCIISSQEKINGEWITQKIETKKIDCRRYMVMIMRESIINKGDFGGRQSTEIGYTYLGDIPVVFTLFSLNENETDNKKNNTILNKILNKINNKKPKTDTVKKTMRIIYEYKFTDPSKEK